jgi:hypothetical protein
MSGTSLEVSMRFTILPLIILGLAACGRRAHDSPDAFRWEAEIPPGSTLHLRTVVGAIDVARSDGKATRVTGSTHWVGRNDPIHFAWRRDGDEVYVCALWSSHGDCTDEGGGSSGSGHSWLDIFSLFKRRSTNAVASLRVVLPPGVTVDAHTMTGEISLRGTTAGVTAQTLNGGINIEHAAGPVEAKGVNGAIHVALDSLGPEDNVSIQSVNGSATAVLPPDFEGEVQLSTVNGGVRTDFPITADGEMSNRELHGQVGKSSSREIELRTINGDVSLLRQGGVAMQTDTGVTLRVRRAKR